MLNRTTLWELDCGLENLNLKEGFWAHGTATVRVSIFCMQCMIVVV